MIIVKGVVVVIAIIAIVMILKTKMRMMMIMNDRVGMILLLLGKVLNSYHYEI